MTTITIKQDFPLAQTVFDSIEELIQFLAQQFSGTQDDDFVMERDIDFRMLREDELTPDILAAAEEAQKQYQEDPSQFISSVLPKNTERMLLKKMINCLFLKFLTTNKS